MICQAHLKTQIKLKVMHTGPIQELIEANNEVVEIHSLKSKIAYNFAYKKL